MFNFQTKHFDMEEEEIFNFGEKMQNATGVGRGIRDTSPFRNAQSLSHPSHSPVVTMTSRELNQYISSKLQE